MVYNSSYTYMEGTSGVTLDDVAHVIIPGRYRSADGLGLSMVSQQRVDTAAEFFIDYDIAEKGGVIIPTGYKNPLDTTGEPWRDDTGNEYIGIPEAYGARARLLSKYAISPSNIRVDPDSIDSVLNTTNGQRLLPDQRPVAFAAQADQLERFMHIIAPAIMRSPYIGIVVPEHADHPDKDTPILADAFSRYVVRGLRPTTVGLEDLVSARVNTLVRGRLAVSTVLRSLASPLISRLQTNSD